MGKSNVYLKGWARVLAYGGGWDGWIRFDHGQSSEVYIDKDGDFHGWAWSDMVVGWISFNSSDPGAGGGPYKVSLSIPNQPPIADANGPYTVFKNNTILLDGTGSYDPDGSIVSYLWSGQCVSYLDDKNISQPTFRAPEVSSDTSYSCTLTVTDNDGATNSTTTTIIVKATIPAPHCSVSLSSDLTKDWIWQTEQITLTWSGANIVQCRRWIEVWSLDNVLLKNTSFGDTIPYDNWTSDWNNQTSGSITTYPGSGPPHPDTGEQPRNWIGKLWKYRIECKDSSGLCVEDDEIEVNVKPRPIWYEVAP